MAVSKESANDLEKLIECSICLDRLVNPKDLNCSHSFCKSCIEDIMVFSDDTSAIIRCPLRCDEETVIAANKTVNDLRTSFHLKSIVEHFNKAQNTEKVRQRCINTPECEITPCFYCKSCHGKMCHTCKINHAHGDNNTGKDLIHFKCSDKDQEKLLPWCDKHSTYATYKCEDGFICSYCKIRSHSKHNFHKIDTLYDEFHTWIINQQPQVKNFKELIKKCHVRSTNETKRINDMLMKEIRARKKLSLEKYIEKLDLEEERIMKTFNNLISENFECHQFSSPLEYIKDKSQFEVLVERENIVEKVNNITSENVMLPQLSIHYPQESINEEHPLGTIHGVNVPVALGEGTVTVHSEITESTFNIDRLHILLEELNVSISDTFTEQKHADVNTMYDVSCKDKVADVMRIYQENGTDMKSKVLYLMDLMEKNDIETFGILLDKSPGELLGLCDSYGDKLIHITSLCENVTFTLRLIEAGEDVDCKDDDGWTPLHHAAMCGNINVVKLLIDNNADMLVKGNDDCNAIDHAKRFNHPLTVKYLEDVLKKKGKVDDGKWCNMNFEQMKRRGLVIKEKCNLWNIIKGQLKL